MKCVCLLGSAQLLKPQHWIGRCHPHFLFRIDFGSDLATTKNPGSPRYDMTSSKGMWCCSHAGTVNDLKPVVHVLFQSCQVSWQLPWRWKILDAIPVSPYESPEARQGTLAHSLGNCSLRGKNTWNSFCKLPLGCQPCYSDSPCDPEPITSHSGPQFPSSLAKTRPLSAPTSSSLLSSLV